MRTGLCSAVVLVLAACSTSPSSGLDAGSSTDAHSEADAGASDLGPSQPDAAAPDTGVAACDPPAATDPGVARTSLATFRGTARGTTYAYLGLRYAAPPLGALRFANPAPPACEAQIVDATAFGAICPQLDRNDQPTGDEDCLTLNVWTPMGAPPVLLPVLFFIHGGGNNQGSSAVTVGTRLLYDGEALAGRGAVVVTINYRLGALGFAANDALGGNYALRDQIAALGWVHDNITAFGGDPARVMIFGESAGGVDVCALYASPLARGLFARAVIESGGCVAAPKSIGAAATQRLIDGAGCSSAADPIACLRSKTPAELLAALPPVVTGLAAPDFGPIVDGEVLTQAPLAAFAAGAGAGVPLILGSNERETYLLLPPPAEIATEAAYQQAARAFLAGSGVPADRWDAVLAIYPVADYGNDPHAALVALTTDVRWSCPARVYLGTLAEAPGPAAPLFRYYFTRGLDPTRAPMVARAGAYHGLELFYLFGSIDGAGGYRPSADDLALSTAMQHRWVAFAASGDPNGAELPPWPAYDAATDPYLHLDVPTSTAAGVRAAQCDALEAALR